MNDKLCGVYLPTKKKKKCPVQVSRYGPLETVIEIIRSSSTIGGGGERKCILRSCVVTLDSVCESVWEEGNRKSVHLSMDSAARRRGGGGVFEGLYKVFMRRTSVYVTFVIAGAFLGERVCHFSLSSYSNVRWIIPFCSQKIRETRCRPWITEFTSSGSAIMLGYWNLHHSIVNLSILCLIPCLMQFVFWDKRIENDALVGCVPRFSSIFRSSSYRWF